MDAPDMDMNDYANGILGILDDLRKINSDYPVWVIESVCYNPGDCSWGWWDEYRINWLDHDTFKKAAYMFIHWFHDLQGNIPPKEILEVTEPMIRADREAFEKGQE